MVPKKKRKPKADIIFSIMDTLVKAGSRGIIFNSSLAKSHKWSDRGMGRTLDSFVEKGIAICTEKGCHNKRYSCPHEINSVEECLLRYYGGSVPKRYQKHITIPVVKERKVPKRTLSVIVRGIFGKNDPLRKRLEDFFRESREIEKILLQMVSEVEREIERIKKIQPKVGLG